MKETETNGDGLIELYRKYRPKRLDQIIGQPQAVASLQAMIDAGKIPHVLLLTGPSGTGKTTIARILKGVLGCSDIDYEEINCASLDSPLQTARDIKRRMNLSPMGGPVRLFLLDEFQSLSRATYSQQALLETLEDTPNHVYFVLATSNSGKVDRAILTRSTRIDLNSLGHEDMGRVIRKVASREGLDLSESVIDKIVESASGSARDALVTLHRIANLEDNERLEAIQSSGLECTAFAIAKALFNPKSRWVDIVSLLEDAKDNPEQIRQLVLSYATKVILGKGKQGSWAYMVICAFESHFHDSGKAGLVRACYEVLENRAK